MKKFLTAVFFATFITLNFTGCLGSMNTFRHLEKSEVIKIMQTEKDFILLDVRTKKEYDKNHIPNAVLLPIEEIKKGNIEKTLPNKNQKILIYCWTGRRAEDSAAILVKKGYRNVYEFGGLIDWTGEVENTEVDE